MKTKKKLLEGLVPGTEAYVLAHYQWRKARGRKNPSEIIKKIKLKLEWEPFKPIPETSERAKRHNEFLRQNRKLVNTYKNISNPKRSLHIALRHQRQYDKNPEKAIDKEYEEYILLSVKKHDNRYKISTDLGSTFITSTTIVPKVGDIVRFYKKEFGPYIRGIDIEGEQIRYQSPRQLELEHQKDRIKSHIESRIETYQKRKQFNGSDLDKRFETLPNVYQQRIKVFRRNNPNFRWEHENSEIYMLEQSLLLAKFLHKETSFFGKYVPFGRVHPELLGSYHEEIKKTHDNYKDYDGQLEDLIPGFGDGHSGNSLRFIFRMAFLYLTHPIATIHQHGWLVSVYGCKNYGCHRSLAKKEKKGLITLT